jgi:uncharacterized membrane-anchored protein
MLAGLGVGAAEGARKHKADKPASDDAKPAPAAAADDEAGDQAAAGEGAKPKYKPIEGPQQVDAGHDVMVDLPANYLFLDAEQAKRFMESLGNLHNDDLMGVITQEDATWLVAMRFTDDGYVKDDEAEKMDADEILKAIREGTEAANEERSQKGFKPMHVVGWSEPPHYRRDVHHLIWGIRGQGEGEAEVVNYNTRVLGRKGYVSLNLIDDAANIEASKPAVAALLGVTHFKPGSRYEDFDKKNDKVAEYGLAALVAGGAGAVALKLVKVGLIAKFAGKILALIVALKKAIVLAFLAFVAFLKRVFGRKKDVAPAGIAVSPNLVVPPPSASGVEKGPTEGGPGGQGGA